MDSSSVVVVVIGRNEGERLRASLASIAATGTPFVYVDSGSDDDSVKIAAAARPAALVVLERPPFSAAAARNAGFAAARERFPQARYMQFLDGDCLLETSWLPTGAAFLDAHEKVAVTAGRRVEQHPEATIFNDACDVEWGLLGGNPPRCTGDMLVRATVFEQVGGFRPFFVCGEEADLLGRMELVGYGAQRLDVPMSRHDADIRRWKQWGKRAQRGGLAVALGAVHYPAHMRRSSLRAALRPLFWAFVLPLSALVALASGAPACAALLLAAGLWPGLRGAQAARRSGRAWGSALRFGVFCILDKGPMLWGECHYVAARLRQRGARLIEYK